MALLLDDILRMLVTWLLCLVWHSSFEGRDQPWGKKSRLIWVGSLTLPQYIFRWPINKCLSMPHSQKPTETSPFTEDSGWNHCFSESRRIQGLLALKLDQIKSRLNLYVTGVWLVCGSEVVCEDYVTVQQEEAGTNPELVWEESWPWVLRKGWAPVWWIVALFL
jgi:hypothetical protein